MAGVLTASLCWQGQQSAVSSQQHQQESSRPPQQPPNQQRESMIRTVVRDVQVGWCHCCVWRVASAVASPLSSSRESSVVFCWLLLSRVARRSGLYYCWLAAGSSMFDLQDALVRIWFFLYSRFSSTTYVLLQSSLAGLKILRSYEVEKRKKEFNRRIFRPVKIAPGGRVMWADSADTLGQK